MNLTDKLQDAFIAKIRGRGRIYFKNSQVLVSEINKDVFETMVFGTSTYQVSLTLIRANCLEIDCTCPYFESGMGFCKHLWATILAADKSSWPQNIPEKINLVPSDSFGMENDDDDLDDDDWDDYKFDYDEFDDDDESEGVDPNQHSNEVVLPAANRRFANIMSARNMPDWQQSLEKIKNSMEVKMSQSPPKEIKVVYDVDIPGSLYMGRINLNVLVSEKKKNGEWGKSKKKKINWDFVSTLPEADKNVLSLLLGAEEPDDYRYSRYAFNNGNNCFNLPVSQQEKILREVCATGEAFVTPCGADNSLLPLSWDGSGAWEFKLSVKKQQKCYKITGYIVKNNEKMDLSVPHLFIAGGLVFWEDKVARLLDSGSFGWIVALREAGAIKVPLAGKNLFLEKLYSLPNSPAIDFPENIQIEKIYPVPDKQLFLQFKKDDYRRYPPLIAKVSFAYADAVFAAATQESTFFKKETQQVVCRDFEVETEAVAQLYNLGFTEPPSTQADNRAQKYLELKPGRLSEVVPVLLENKWQVIAHNKKVRQSTFSDIRVSSGIDWFELSGGVEFGDYRLSLPDILKAVKEGQDMITLGDGSMGILPADWLKEYKPLLELGEVKKRYVKFKQNQAMLLDVLLANQKHVNLDETFIKIRERLKNFSGFEPMSEPKGFTGKLRDYQKDGLGWLAFIRDFGFGGCLADDMGLGKTVQMLAMLQIRKSVKKTGAKPKATLIVVPKSLLFNWQEEARRFTPDLKTMIFAGLQRKSLLEKVNDYDLVFLTYGILRRDIVKLKDIKWDYVVLDEAQAIKNSKSQVSKAAKLLQAQSRIALSGTPVENHIGELWSLFEFLNPGMLGRVSAFAKISTEGSGELLGKALRPFILRRTKDQVARDLPAKTEQIIYCDMDKKQQLFYDELKKYYQAKLLIKDNDGRAGKFKIQVLEALLRLRQAACHPGLIHEKRREESTAKLEMLQEQLLEVVAEGHKALVFSQFTSFLGIVRPLLDKLKIPYLYLDGKSRNRQKLVTSFQQDEKYRVFLISLKAGGLGLNLTAAEYVFLLDPWWNPAVETQAIDRVHRIGQSKSVFAYRLISRGTVEEKVLELQKKKKKLVESIINQDNSIIKNLTREDLTYLLS